MRILHLLSQTQLTGAEVHAGQLALDMSARGHKIWMMSDEFHIEDRLPGITLLRAPIHRAKTLGRLKTAWRLSKVILNEDIQVLHCHSRAAARIAAWTSLFIRFLFWKKRPLIVTTFHGRHPPSLSKKLRSIYGDLEISICENVREFHRAQRITHQRQQILLRNPIVFKSLPSGSTMDDGTKNSFESRVNTANSVETQINPSSTSSKFQTDSRSATWSLIGRWTGPKGERFVWLLENVFRPLLQRHSNLHLQLLGGSPEDLNLKDQDSLKEFLKLFPNRAHWLGKTEGLNKYFKTSNLVFGGGRVALEALSEGAEVVALGEASFEGRVETSSLSRCFQSNFGDIDHKNPPWEAKKIQDHLEEVLTNPLPPSQKEELLQRIVTEFDHKIIAGRLERLYASGLIQLRSPEWIPVLMYHQVVPEDFSTPHKIYVTAKTFEEHLKELQRLGKTPLHFRDLHERRQNIIDGKRLPPLPKKPVILTFDDGYLNNLTEALPLLEKYNTKATIFLLADSSLDTNSWDKGSGAPEQKLLSPTERQKLASHPLIEIGAHGFRHQKMTEMSEEERLFELQESKKSLEKEFKFPILTYAYTYGARSEDASLLAERSGYSYAVNTDTGGLHHEEDPFSIFRVSIFPQDRAPQIRKKTSSWYRRYYFFKRGQ